MQKRRVRSLAFLLLILVSWTAVAAAEETGGPWPQRVLITNDDGIDDPKIAALARGFSTVAETFVVAPLEDKSGTSNYVTLGTRKLAVEVEQRSLGQGIVAYGLDGYPADCVFFGLLGLLKDRPPDLVVSGINRGPNLGPEWIGSGTIGAARMAAFAGIPALAVSGLDAGQPDAVAAAVAWVVALGGSPIVRELGTGQFLTVSIPRVQPSEIQGIRVVPRATLELDVLPRLVRQPHAPAPMDRELWVLQPPAAGSPEATGDVAAYGERFIAVVPMKVDEVDYGLLAELEGRVSEFPDWPQVAEATAADAAEP